jgi:hypothetical protein
MAIRKPPFRGRFFFLLKSKFNPTSPSKPFLPVPLDPIDEGVYDPVMISNSPRFLAVCLNPTFQRTVRLKKLEKGEVNRARLARLDASGKGINVSRVLQQLGAPVRHLTHLGPGRDEFLRLCGEDNLQISWGGQRFTDTNLHHFT